MDVEELSMIGPVVDLASVDAIHRKRIVAFVNHFIIHTTNFLNRLSCTVESKLFQVDDRIQKLEASVVLLESKLSSIPGLEIETPVVSEPVPQNSNQIVETGQKTDAEEVQVQQKEPEETVDEPLDESLLRYFKMLQFGVPIPAVKLKMAQEGISAENQQRVIKHCKIFVGKEILKQKGLARGIHKHKYHKTILSLMGIKTLAAESEVRNRVYDVRLGKIGKG